MLARIVRLVGEVCDQIVVVKSTPEQTLPPLAANVIIDQRPAAERGPLEGLAAGLAALPADVEAAFVTTCDAPLIVPAFMARLFELLGDHSAAVPVSDGFVHPLSAVYRTSMLDLVEELLASDRHASVAAVRLRCLASGRAGGTCAMSIHGLDTLKNLNYPADYLAALAQAGFSAAGQTSWTSFLQGTSHERVGCTPSGD